MGFPTPTDSPFTGAQDWWSYAITDAYDELFAGTVTPDLVAESALIVKWNSWADYFIDLHTRAAKYGGETNAQRLAKVQVNQGAILADLAAIKSKVGA